MNNYDWVGKALGKLTVFCCWASFKGFMAATRLAAQGTAAILPNATSMEAVMGQAVLAGFGWMFVIGLLVALAGNATLTLWGFGAGGVVGLLIAYGLVDRGRAQVKVAAGAVEFGERTGAMGVVRPHVVARATRVRHLAVFGATGTGKSTVLKNLVRQDAAAPGNPGILCIDVKDDLVLDVAAHLPPERAYDVLLFDPADTAYPPAFNPLADVPAAGRTLAAAELLSALKRLFADS